MGLSRTVSEIMAISVENRKIGTAHARYHMTRKWWV